MRFKQVYVYKFRKEIDIVIFFVNVIVIFFEIKIILIKIEVGCFDLL